MAQIITITNITKTANSQYSVGFSSNFTLEDLFYEVSLDGSEWQTPVALAQLTSPQTITLANAVNFNLRLSSNYTAPHPSTRIHTNVFTNIFN